MRWNLTGLVLSSSLALVGCGDSPTETPASGDRLTEEEAVALVEVSLLDDDIFDRMLEVGFTSSAVQFTSPCSMGGTVAVNGQGDLTENTASESVTLSLSTTLVHSDCVIRHNATGAVFTLNGAPDLDVNLAIEFAGDLGGSGDLLAYDGMLDGAVRWATNDGRSGSCPMDLDLELTGDENLQLTGRACGVQVSEIYY